MGVLWKASQWQEMFCHDPEGIGSNSGWVELWCAAVLLSKSDCNQNYK